MASLDTKSHHGVVYILVMLVLFGCETWSTTQSLCNGSTHLISAPDSQAVSLYLQAEVAGLDNDRLEIGRLAATQDFMKTVFIA